MPLSESEATLLIQHWDRIPEDQRDLAQERLREYTISRRQQQGPLFPEQVEKTAGAREQSLEFERWMVDDVTPPHAKELDAGALAEAKRLSGLAHFLRKPARELAKDDGVYLAHQKKLAQDLGVDWGENGEGLDMEMKRRLAADRAERWLLVGKEGDDEESEKSRRGSLLGAAHQTAINGKPLADALALLPLLEEHNKDYRKEKTAQYRASMQAVYEKTMADKAAAREDAGVIFNELKLEFAQDKLFADRAESLKILRGQSPYEVALRFQAVQEMAKKAGVGDKGFGEKLNELLGRQGSRLVGGFAEPMGRAFLHNFKHVQEGEEIPVEDLANGLEKYPETVMNRNMAGAGGGAPNLMGLFRWGQKETRKITLAEANAINETVENLKADADLDLQLDRLGKGVVDPIYSSEPWRDLGWKMLETGVSFATYLIPGGMIANGAAYVNDSYAYYVEQGIPRDTAQGMALVSGSAQAALDKLQLKALPGVSRVLGKWAAPVLPSGNVARAAVLGGGVAANTAFQAGIEVAQDYLTNAAVQDLAGALGADVPEVDWKKVSEEAWAHAPELFVIMLPLVLMGQGQAHLVREKQWAEVVQSPLALRMAGFSEETAAEISRAENPTEAVRMRWTQRDATGESAKLALAEFRERMALMRAALTAEVEKAEREGLVEAVGRANGGWYIQKGGKRIPVEKQAAALAIVEDLRQARTQAEADSWVDMAETFASRVKEAQPEEQLFTGELELVREDASRVAIRTTTGEGREVATNEATQRNLREELALLETAANENGIAGVVLGSNARETVADGTIVLVRRLNEGGTAIDLTHEYVEQNYRRALDAGEITAADAVEFVKQGAAALERNRGMYTRILERERERLEQMERRLKNAQLAAKGRPDFLDESEETLLDAQAKESLRVMRRDALQKATEEAPLREKQQQRVREAESQVRFLDQVAAIASGQGHTAGALRESVVRLAVADLLGRGQDGEKLPAGQVSRAVDAAIRAGLGNAEDTTGLQKFRAFLDAARRLFRGIFQTAAALKKARKEGFLDADYEKMIDTLVGLDGRLEERKHNAAVIEEAFALVEAGRASQHRLFEGGTPLRAPDTAFQGLDPDRMYRITGEAQIEDMKESGVVRAKEGKMRGGRYGETHWSRGHERLWYPANAPAVLEAAVQEGEGGIPVNEVVLHRYRNGRWVQSRIENGVEVALDDAVASFSLAGPNANLPAFQRDSLEAARAMAAAGKDSEEIRAVTGWFPGKYDGKMRWEIPDEGAKLKPVVKSLENRMDATILRSITYFKNGNDWELTLVKKDATAVKDVITFKSIPTEVVEGLLPEKIVAQMQRGEGADDLGSDLETPAKTIVGEIEFDGFNALPLDVVLDHEALFAAYPGISDVMVQIEPGIIGGSLQTNEDGSHVITAGSARTLATLLHEIQHWIQEKEGFARGGSPENFGFEGLVANADKIAALDRELEKARAKFPDLVAIENKIKAGQDPTDAEWDLHEQIGSQEPFKSLAERRLKLIKTPLEAYRSLAGEIESRDVQARQTYTPEQRQAIAPYSSENIAPEDAIVMFHDGASFSLSPADRLDTVAESLRTKLDTTAEGTRDYLERASTRLGKLRESWENLPAPVSPAKLDAQQRKLHARALKEAMDFHQSAVEAEFGDAIANEDLAKMTAHPLFDLLRSSRSRRQRIYSGRLRSPGRAAERDAQREQISGIRQTHGDYEGLDGVTRMVFGGDEAPDQLAQEAFDAGLINGPLPEDLWNGILRAQKEVSTNKERLEKAREALKSARETARKQAREVADSWRAEQDAQQLRVGNAREAASRDVALLDAVVLALPPEVRGRIKFGGADFAKLATDKSFAREMQKRIGVIAKALDAHWREVNKENLRRLLQYTGDARTPGEKPKGKIGPEAHRYFDLVTAAVKLDEMQVVGARARAEAEFEAAPDAAAEARAKEKLQVLTQWGNFDLQTAAEQAAALKAGWQVAKTGRNEWGWKEEMRLKGQRVDAKKVIEQLGQGTYDKLAVDDSLSGVVGRMAIELRDFEGVMSALLGREHALTRRWSDAVGAAYMQKDRALARIRKDFDLETRLIFGVDSSHKIRKALWKLHTERTIGIEIFVEEADPTLTAEDRATLKQSGETIPRIRSEVKITQDEGIFLTMLAAQRQYKAPLEAAGWTDAVLQKIEKALSSEAKGLRQYLTRMYRDGYFPLNALYRDMFGVDLPRIENYAPARFYNAGREKPMDTLGAGVLTGGGFEDGFLKTRKEHTAKVQLHGALALYWAHQNQTQHWFALAPVVRQVRGVFRSPDVKMAVEGVWGKRGNALLETWFQALEGNGISQNAGDVERFISAATSRFAVARLAYNVGTLIKQGSAAFYTALDLGPREYALGFGQVMMRTQTLRDVWQSDAVQRRLENGTTPEIRAVLDDFWNSEPGRAKQILEKGMELIGFVDAAMTSFGAAIAYEAYARRAERSGMDAAQAHAVAMEQMARTVERTAQPVSVERRSITELRTGAFGKLMWMFASDARQKTGLWLEAWGNVFKRQGTRRDASVLLLSHVVLGGIMTTLTSLVRDWRDGDDEDELEDDPNWEWEYYLVGMILGPASGLPLLGELVGWLGDKFAGNRAFEPGGTNVIAEPVVKGLQSGSRLIGEMLDDEAADKEKVEKDIIRIFEAMGGSGAVGAKAYKEAENIVDRVIGEKETK